MFLCEVEKNNAEDGQDPVTEGQELQDQRREGDRGQEPDTEDRGSSMGRGPGDRERSRYLGLQAALIETGSLPRFHWMNALILTGPKNQEWNKETAGHRRGQIRIPAGPDTSTAPCISGMAAHWPQEHKMAADDLREFRLAQTALENNGISTKGLWN